MQKLLLLHGAIGNKDQFDELESSLRNVFEVHALNFSGHGGAQMPEKFSLKGFVEDVIRFIEGKELGQVTVFGYSMGGYVAIETGRIRPDLIGKVFTLATKFYWTPEIALKESAMLNPEKIYQKVPAFADLLATRHAPNDWREVLQKTAEFLTELGDSTPLALSEIKLPVRIAIGDRDAMVSFEESEQAYRELQNGSFVVLPDTAHQFEKVSVERLSKELIDFFN